eukprot:6195867-Pleurochrysis_carterae.AAC.3
MGDIRPCSRRSRPATSQEMLPNEFDRHALGLACPFAALWGVEGGELAHLWPEGCLPGGFSAAGAMRRTGMKYEECVHLSRSRESVEGEYEEGTPEVEGRGEQSRRSNEGGGSGRSGWKESHE